MRRIGDHHMETLPDGKLRCVKCGVTIKNHKLDISAELAMMNKGVRPHLCEERTFKK